MSKHERFLAWGAFAIVCVVWGTTYLAIRVAIETIPTFLLAGLRFTIAGIILLAICAATGQRIPRQLSDWLHLTLIGILLLGVANVAVVWSEHFIASGLAALLVATAPFWMITIEAVRTRGAVLTARKLTGMAIGFIGVGILAAPDLRPASFNAKFLIGVLVLQGASIAWNLGSVLSKYRPADGSPLAAAAIQMLCGGVIILVVGLALGEGPRLHFSARSLVAFLYLMIFGSIIAYGAYVYALSKLPTENVSLYAYINPAVAVVLGWAILDEPLGWRAVGSMVVILAGVALVQARNLRLPSLRRMFGLGERVRPAEG